AEWSMDHSTSEERPSSEPSAAELRRAKNRRQQRSFRQKQRKKIEELEVSARELRQQ
ncbi:unnamed protein product, partial [Ostreobium quekettii]